MKDRIRQLRQQNHLTQAEFSVRIGKTPGFISLVENGRSGLADKTIRIISQQFNVSEEWLRYGRGEMKETQTTDTEGIGSRIKQVRKMLGLSQDEFAKKAEIHRNQVGRVETGKLVPSKAFINKVVRAFNISYDWLVTGEGDMENQERVDEKLIEWMNAHPEVIREVRERAGM